MTEGSVPTPAKELELVNHLVEAGKIDTVYRDIYLHHALSIISPLFPRDEFLKLSEYGKQAEDFVRKARIAAERNEWQDVRDFTARINYLRTTRQERERLMSAAAEVYEPADVVVDPFSPGLRAYIAEKGRNPSDLHHRISEIFNLLQSEDSPSRGFYEARAMWFTSLPFENQHGDRKEKRADPARLQRDALQAVERGDVENLDRLLREMETAGVVVLQGRQKRPMVEADLLEPFPPSAVKAAAAAGMVEAEVGAAPRVSDFLWTSAWQPNLPEQQPTQDGHIRISGNEGNLPADLPDPLRETLEMFMLHPFVNSGGVRYLPTLAAERFLVENFPEDAPAGGPLLELLGLPRRNGLARVTLETALLQKGPDILRTRFDLDPCLFRLVCIPFDLYGRLGHEKGWGSRPQWTHFDGYQLLRGGGVRALVGGDVRYGGVFDLCSISDFDEREGVIVRFAVVRRKRMLQPG